MPMMVLKFFGGDVNFARIWWSHFAEMMPSIWTRDFMEKVSSGWESIVPIKIKVTRSQGGLQIRSPYLPDNQPVVYNTALIGNWKL